MATLTWISLNNGFWNDPDNWLGGIFPGYNPEDDVIIDVDGDITTTHDGGDTVIRNFTTAEIFHLLEGSLTVENATLDNTFILGSSLYDPDGPYFIVNGVANLNADSYLWYGTLTGIFNNNGTLTFEEGARVTLQDATLNNDNIIRQKNGGWISLKDATIRTVAGAIYNIEGGGLDFWYGSENFFNLDGGTLRKTTSDTGTIAVQVNSTNGAITVEAGTLELKEGGELIDTEINIARNGTLLLEYGDDYSVYRFRNTAISGSGDLAIDTIVDAEDTVTFSDNTTLLSSAWLQGNEFINPEFGTLKIVGSTTNATLEATLFNKGIIEQESTGFSFDNGTLINEGTYKLFGVRDLLPLAVEGETDVLITYDDGLGSGEAHLSNRGNGGKIINEVGGFIVTEQGPGDYDSYVEIQAFLEDKGGTINLGDGGTLALSGGGEYNNGTKFILEKDAILQFDGGHHLFRDGVTFDQQGIVAFSGSATEIEVVDTLYLGGKTIWGDILGFSFLQGSSPDSKFVNRGDFRITTGVKVLAGYDLPFLDPYEHILKTTLVNEEGAIIEHAPGYIDLQIAEGGRIDNYGEYKFFVEDGYESGFAAWIQGDGEINNFSSGLFTKTGSQEGLMWVAFNNLGGTVNVQESILNLGGGGENENGEYLIAENARLIFGWDTSFLNTRFNNLGELYLNDDIKFRGKHVLDGQVYFDRGTKEVDEELVFQGETTWSDTNYSETKFLGEGKLINEGRFTIDNGTSFGIANEFTNENILSILDGLVYVDNTLTNVSGATLTLGYTTITDSTDKDGIISNKGLIEKIDENLADVWVFVENDNSLVDVRAGELHFAGGGQHTNTLFQIAAGAKLYLAGTEEYSHQFQQTTFENEGIIELGSSGYYDPIALEALDDVTLPGSVEWTGGAIAGPASVTITDDFLIHGSTSLNTKLYTTGNTTIQYWSRVWFEGGEWDNLGSLTMDAGELNVWANESGVFRNQGSFYKTTSEEATFEVHFESTGELFIEGGRLTLEGGGILGGKVEILSDATLVLDDEGERSFTFTENSIFNNQGNLEIGAQIIAEDLLTLNGNTEISGELAGAGYRNEGNLRIADGTIASEFANAGTVELLYSDDLTLENSTFTNLAGATFYTENGTIQSSNGSSTHQFLNQGILNVFSTLWSTFEVELVNDGGEINIQQKTLFLTEAFTQTAGRVFLEENTELESSDVLKFEGGSVEGEGTITSSDNPVEFGAVEINIGLTDGDVGTMYIAGNSVESDATTHYIDINSHSEYDQLVYDGNVHLDGVYVIRLDEAFKDQLAVGNRFEIVQFAGYTLDDGIELVNADIGNGLAFKEEFDGDSLDLVVVNTNNTAQKSANLNTLEDSSSTYNPITGTADNDSLVGTSGRDLIMGLDGDDLLDGGAGSDQLIGGAGADEFVLRPGQGADTIVDYEDGQDSFLLEGGLTFGQLQISQNNGDTLIAIASTGELLASLIRVQANEIGMEDFAVLV